MSTKRMNYPMFSNQLHWFLPMFSDVFFFILPMFLDLNTIFARDKQGSNAETDFVWQKGTQIIPIEVKCGSNAHLRSLHSFIDLSGGDLAVRVWNGPYSIDEVKTVAGRSFRLLNLPYYYLGSLPKILSSI